MGGIVDLASDLISGPDTPDVPDYAGAAQEQAKSSRNVTEQQTWANRPNQYTPFGSQTWDNQQVWDPSTQQWLNRWNQTTTLTPELQAAAEAQQRTTQARSRLAEGLTGRLQNEMGAPMDWSQFRPSGQAVAAQDYGDVNAFRQRQEDALYGKATSRLDPQWGQRENQMRVRLANQGLQEGDEAYNIAQANFGRDRNDAYQQAQYGAVTGGGAEMINQVNAGGQMQAQGQQASSYQNTLRQQDIAEALQKRGASLNEINAALSGQQVNMPNMPNFQGAQASQPIQALAAAQMTGQGMLDRYNADQQAKQGLMSGIQGAGTAFMMGGM